MEHLHTPQNTILLFCCVMTNLELLHHDDHLLWVERMMCIQLSGMWSSNRKRLHRIQWRTFGQWRRTQKRNIFPFTSSGNKQKTTIHMKDAEKFNEREKDCWHQRYDCGIAVKKIMNELMIHLILHDAWWWNHSLSFHSCYNERNKWMSYRLVQKRKDLWMMFHCWE